MLFPESGTSSLTTSGEEQHPVINLDSKASFLCAVRLVLPSTVHPLSRLVFVLLQINSRDLYFLIHNGIVMLSTVNVWDDFNDYICYNQTEDRLVTEVRIQHQVLYCFNSPSCLLLILFPFYLSGVVCTVGSFTTQPCSHCII